MSATAEQLRAEMRETNRAMDRQPVAMFADHFGRPVVICKDGSLWTLKRQPIGEGDEEWWAEGKPVPGSQRSLSYTEGPDGDSPDEPFLAEDGPIRRTI